MLLLSILKYSMIDFSLDKSSETEISFSIRIFLKLTLNSSSFSQ